MPAVTVAMTAFNRARYIGPAIESVLQQSFCDFELVIVDDASTDETVQVASRYLSDERVRIEVNDANLGDYGNRNRAASLAHGEFLKYHDSDDVMYPHCLSTMHDALAAEPRAALALSGANAWTGGPCPMLLSPRQAYEREFLGSGIFSRGPSNALFRTELFREWKGFPQAGVASDYVFWLDVCARAHVLLVPADLHWYRIHDGQLLNSENALHEYASSLSFAWKSLNSPTCPLSGKSLDQAKANFVFAVCRQVYAHVRAGRPADARTVVQGFNLPVSQWMLAFRRKSLDPMAGTPLLESGEVGPTTSKDNLLNA